MANIWSLTKPNQCQLQARHFFFFSAIFFLPHRGHGHGRHGGHHWVRHAKCTWYSFDGICQTQPKWLQILRRQGHEQIKQRFTLYIFYFWFSSHCGSCLAINSQFSNKHDFLQTTPTLTLIRKAALAEQLLVVSLRDLAGALLPLVETSPAPPSISLLSQSRCQHKDRNQCCKMAKLTKTYWIRRELTKNYVKSCIGGLLPSTLAFLSFFELKSLALLCLCQINSEVKHTSLWLQWRDKIQRSLSSQSWPIIKQRHAEMIFISWKICGWMLGLPLEVPNLSQSQMHN